jgi:hypothetical protein
MGKVRMPCSICGTTRLVQSGLKERKPICKSCHYRRTTPIRAFSIHTQKALERGLVWNLSFQEFMNLYGQPCVYCGQVPDRIGLDRIDNAKGYESANVVPCCWICNDMRGRMTIEAFLKHVLLIASRM